MSDRFADSNVLLYLAASDDGRAAIARELVGDGLTISVQVLNEMTT